MIAHNNNVVADVTISCPINPTYVGAASGATLHAAMKAEQRKHAKYDTAARENGFTFYPFAIEVFGGWGPAAAKLLKHIGSMSAAVPEHMRSWTHNDIMRGLVESVAVAVQLGNANVIQQGIARCTLTVRTR